VISSILEEPVISIFWIEVSQQICGSYVEEGSEWNREKRRKRGPENGIFQESPL
jgi:hypothetical protein